MEFQSLRGFEDEERHAMRGAEAFLRINNSGVICLRQSELPKKFEVAR